MRSVLRVVSTLSGRKRPRPFRQASGKRRGFCLTRSMFVLKCALGPAMGAPSAAERALVKSVQAQQDGSIALLEEIVIINRGTMNFAGVRRVADVLRPRFEALGFKVRWEDGAAFGRAG